MLQFHSALTVIVPAVVAFIATLVAGEFIKSYFVSSGIIAEDRNKPGTPKLPGSGGMAIAFGVIVGILAYAFGGSFVFAPQLNISNMLASALSIMLIAVIGFIDDINVTSRRQQATGMKDIRKGLKQWQKPLLTLLGALPLMALNVGVTIINVPFLGAIDFGILYPLVIIPLAVVFVANAYNLLGGFNGLETSTGLVAALGFLIYSYWFGNTMGFILSAILVMSMLAFLKFNWYPAQILPGDSLTYAIGGAFVSIMIMGQAEAFGVIVFIPWMLEFFLHLRSRFKTTDLGILQKNGRLKAPYGNKIYSLTHVVMNMMHAKETDVPLVLCVLEALFVALALLMKVSGLLV